MRLRYENDAELRAAAEKNKRLNAVDMFILNILYHSPCLGGIFPVIKYGPRKESQSTQTIPTNVERRTVYTVVDNYHHQKQLLTLQLLRHDIYLRKLTALKLEKDIGLRKSSYNILKAKEIVEKRYFRSLRFL